jgi:hypothetical protein
MAYETYEGLDDVSPIVEKTTRYSSQLIIHLNHELGGSALYRADKW